MISFRCKSKAAVVKSQAWQIALLIVICTVAANAVAAPAAHFIVKLAKVARQ